jgi:TupA-like ATPgrasp
VIPQSLSPIAREVLLRATGRVNYERIQFWRHVGYVPNLHSPKTFNEKIAARKLFANIPEASVLADKVAVRDHVASIVGDKYVNEALVIAEDVADIDFEKLPESFVAKASHGSAMNLLVEDKSQLDIPEARRKLGGFLKQRYGRLMNERWYDSITPRILVERYLRDEKYGIPLDLKVYVYHGKARMIRLIDRHGGYGRSFWDASWTRLPLRFRDNPQGPDIDRPAPLAEIIKVAEALSGGFDYIRVDLYCVNDRDVVFGEMTLAPGSGWSPFESKAQDEYVGSFW